MQANLLIGAGAALAAALLGAGWQLTTRFGVTTTLGPIELAVLRYLTPGLVLLPLWLRLGLRPQAIGWPRLAMLVAGGGLPFGLLVLGGAQLAPAAHIGIFMAGTMPIFTALAAWLVLGETITADRWLGFGVILAGVAWLAAGSLASPAGSWRGDLLFLLAAMAWAGYTLAFRGCGLTAWGGAAVVNGWSALLVCALVAVVGAPRLLTAPIGHVAFQAAGQGVAAGLLGLVAYMAAVSRLGSARAALSSALVPPMTAVGAAWLLNEPLEARTGAAAGMVALGVVLASGALRRKRS